jgi:high-affinity K+ transport system ATPase subunit B
MIRNPVMFVVEVVCGVRDRPVGGLADHGGAWGAALLAVSLRCGYGSRCVFANFAEAVAEGRGKAQALIR